MIAKGSLVPHFSVIDADGTRVEYGGIWQRRNLVLATVPASAEFAGYTASLRAARHAMDAQEATCVVTHEQVAGVPFPGVVVADRWGEIFFVSTESHPTALPPPEEVLDWLRFVQVRCPECEGEWR